ncbi:MAG: response regulator [Phycisphaerae bacterium]|nr:response regulator transcription factor [Phycisphaerae bacterium]NIP53229.1 response regulator transcription factor [Phycisphaerae bacterium]NIS52255.1 response regulator transcription factor [Phycisphaerae bacterium]NIU09801.1 response regulator transcription factor [Phycisphaerae bacterium]NIU59439.1 response regulator [Phycisphaerae bacterium]
MEQKAHILVVEDEQKIRSGLRDFLEFHDFRVSEAVDGLEAQRIVAEKRFDLILLDLMLPKISGEQLCTRWRREGMQTPVIMLTAKGQEKEKVSGLNMGADDYIAKPFSLEELLARIKAVLRRMDPGRAVGQAFKFSDFEVDVAALKVTRGGKEMEISKREAAIIRYFAANPNRVISREELYKAVWNEDMSELGTRTTDMHIAKLRGKIEKNSAEPQIIKTVRGAGYKYEN